MFVALLCTVPLLIRSLTLATEHIDTVISMSSFSLPTQHSHTVFYLYKRVCALHLQESKQQKYTCFLSEDGKHCQEVDCPMQTFVVLFYLYSWKFLQTYRGAYVHTRVFPAARSLRKDDRVDEDGAAAILQDGFMVALALPSATAPLLKYIYIHTCLPKWQAKSRSRWPHVSVCCPILLTQPDIVTNIGVCTFMHVFSLRPARSETMTV